MTETAVMRRATQVSVSVNRAMLRSLQNTNIDDKADEYKRTRSSALNDYCLLLSKRFLAQACIWEPLCFVRRSVEFALRCESERSVTVQFTALPWEGSAAGLSAW